MSARPRNVGTHHTLANTRTRRRSLTVGWWWGDPSGSSGSPHHDDLGSRWSCPCRRNLDPTLLPSRGRQIEGPDRPREQEEVDDPEHRPDGPHQQWVGRLTVGEEVVDQAG